MKTIALAALAAATLASAAPISVHAQEITEFRIGLLGGENASDRMRSNECLREKAEALLGVPTKLFAPADYNGVIEGLGHGVTDIEDRDPGRVAQALQIGQDLGFPGLVQRRQRLEVGGGAVSAATHGRVLGGDGAETQLLQREAARAAAAALDHHPGHGAGGEVERPERSVRAQG